MNSLAEPDLALSIRVVDRIYLEDRLSEAVEAFIPAALTLGDRGILITGVSPSDIIIQLHPDVPFGDIHERQEW